MDAAHIFLLNTAVVKIQFIREELRARKKDFPHSSIAKVMDNFAAAIFFKIRGNFPQVNNIAMIFFLFGGQKWGVTNS